MICPTCGSSLLMEVVLPDHPAALAVVCLGCGSVLPETERAERP